MEIDQTNGIIYEWFNDKVTGMLSGKKGFKTTTNVRCEIREENCGFLLFMAINKNIFCPSRCMNYVHTFQGVEVFSLD